MSIKPGGRRMRRLPAVLAGLALAVLAPAVGATAAQAAAAACNPGAETAGVGRYWWLDRFDDLDNGPLEGQNGWAAGTANPAGANGVDVMAHEGTGPGAKMVRIDAPAGATDTDYRCKNLPDQHNGRHVIELDARANDATSPFVAYVELQMGNSGVVQLYVGSSILLYSTAHPDVHAEVVRQTVSGQWYHVRIEINLDTDRLVVSSPTFPAASVHAPSGPITGVRLRGYEFPGTADLDNLSGAPLAPASSMWASEDFESLSLGQLNGQNGWTATPDVKVRPRTAGGQMLGLHAQPANAEINQASKDVADQSGGRHRFAFDAFMFGASASDAKIEMTSTTPTRGYQRLWQIYLGTSIRINYGPNAANAATIITNVEPTWYHVDMVMDLDAARMTVTVTGARQSSAVTVPIQPGAIEGLTAWSWPRGGLAFLDNLYGQRLADFADDPPISLAAG